MDVAVPCVADDADDDAENGQERLQDVAADRAQRELEGGAEHYRVIPPAWSRRTWSNNRQKRPVIPAQAGIQMLEGWRACRDGCRSGFPPARE